MIRKARIEDIKQIQGLINDFAKRDLVLPRSLNELYENIRDFWVAQINNKIIGCAAMHISWEDLAEVRSVAVKKDKQNKGIGRQLVNACLGEAENLGAKKIFVLTYSPAYFKKFGFRRVKHSVLPHKI
ncbi:MAG: N-acetyltransferase, partial [Candidatus Omnitrophica bacterium]|nr:N-acetyltransferase [Candidatus Omnitrophota bacterium]